MHRSFDDTSSIPMNPHRLSHGNKLSTGDWHISKTRNMPFHDLPNARNLRLSGSVDCGFFRTCYRSSVPHFAHDSSYWGYQADEMFRMATNTTVLDDPKLVHWCLRPLEPAPKIWRQRCKLYLHIYTVTTSTAQKFMTPPPPNVFFFSRQTTSGSSAFIAYQEAITWLWTHGTIQFCAHPMLVAVVVDSTDHGLAEMLFFSFLCIKQFQIMEFSWVETTSFQFSPGGVRFIRLSTEIVEWFHKMAEVSWSTSRNHPQRLCLQSKDCTWMPARISTESEKIKHTNSCGTYIQIKLEVPGTRAYSSAKMSLNQQSTQVHDGTTCSRFNSFQILDLFFCSIHLSNKSTSL